MPRCIPEQRSTAGAHAKRLAVRTWVPNQWIGNESLTCHSLYNVKRRVASLPPVSQEVFTEKVLAAKATSSAAAAKASYERTCVACQKTFYSENSYQNHVRSSKHRSREAALKKKGALADDASSVMSSAFSLGDPVNQSVSGDTESTVSGVTSKVEDIKVSENGAGKKEESSVADDENEEEYPTSRCLFCLEHAADLQANVEHMFKAHGMFIPEREYLVDLEGLIKYLHAKITQNYECLYCHAIRGNAEGVRTHMRDKGHCMIGFDSEEEQIEIGQFYDFRSTYSDADEDEDESAENDGGVPVDDDDDGWETEDSSATSVEADDDKPYKGPKPIYVSDFELHLPSGRSVGHRSLARYYRQNLHNYPTPEERASRQLAIENGTAEPEDQKQNRNHNRAVISRANGGLGMLGATTQQKREALANERRERTRAQREEQKYTAKVNRRANNQKHYRVSFPFSMPADCSVLTPFDRILSSSDQFLSIIPFGVESRIMNLR